MSPLLADIVTTAKENLPSAKLVAGAIVGAAVVVLVPKLVLKSSPVIEEAVQATKAAVKA